MKRSCRRILFDNLGFGGQGQRAFSPPRKGTVVGPGRHLCSLPPPHVRGASGTLLTLYVQSPNSYGRIRNGPMQRQRRSLPNCPGSSFLSEILGRSNVATARFHAEVSRVESAPCCSIPSLPARRIQRVDMLYRLSLRREHSPSLSPCRRHVGPSAPEVCTFLFSPCVCLHRSFMLNLGNRKIRTGLQRSAAGGRATRRAQNGRNALADP